MADTAIPPGGVLGHVCPDCGHSSHDHKLVDWTQRGPGDGVDAMRCRWITCKCAAGGWAWCSTPTVVYPLYVGEGPSAGTPIIGVAPPGESIGGYQSCACDRCLAYYQQATGAEVAR